METHTIYRYFPCWSRDLLSAQSRSAVVEKGGRQLQQLSLLDGDGQRLLLLEKEKQRVAALRRLQIETEQFRYFEDQLKRQELANRRGDGAEQKVTLCPNPPSGVAALFPQ